MTPVALTIEDVFNGSNNRTVPGPYVTSIIKGLLKNLIHFTEKTRNGKRGHFNVTLERQNTIKAGIVS